MGRGITGDKKHQGGVDIKKEWIKSKLKDGHVFRKLNARGKTFIEYEPIETAWVPIKGKNYEYIYCLWVAGSFKGKGIGKELLEYAINDSKEKKMSGICTLVSKKKKPPCCVRTLPLPPHVGHTSGSFPSFVP